MKGSGLFTLTNRTNVPFAVEVEFNCNVTSGTVGAVELAIEINGEAVGGTQMDYTISVADLYQSVGASALVPVPAGSSLTASVGNQSTVAVSVKDANIIIKKLS